MCSQIYGAESMVEKFTRNKLDLLKSETTVSRSRGPEDDVQEDFETLVSFQ